MKNKRPDLTENEAFCARCQTIKNKKEFYMRKSNGKPLSYCMRCQDEVKSLKLEEKIERIVEENLAMCQDCGNSYPVPVFDFYSKNGTYPLSRATNMSFERLKEELKDGEYIMLCKNCAAIRRWAENNEK